MEYDYSGIGAWGIEDLNNTYVSAPAFFDAANTRKTADDRKIIEDALVGNDKFELSSGDDVVYGYSGDDEFYTNYGNDKIDGGSGFDTVHTPYQINEITPGNFDLKSISYNPKSDTITINKITEIGNGSPYNTQQFTNVEKIYLANQPFSKVQLVAGLKTETLKSSVTHNTVSNSIHKPEWQVAITDKNYVVYDSQNSSSRFSTNAQFLTKNDLPEVFSNLPKAVVAENYGYSHVEDLNLYFYSRNTWSKTNYLNGEFNSSETLQNFELLADEIEYHLDINDDGTIGFQSTQVSIPFEGLSYTNNPSYFVYNSNNSKWEAKETYISLHKTSNNELYFVDQKDESYDGDRVF